MSARPCVSIQPTTTSTPAAFRARAASSMANVFPTPAAAPKKSFSLPRAWRASSARTRSSS